jgi:hypothetical protein
MGVSMVVMLRSCFCLLSVFWYCSVRWSNATFQASWTASTGVFGNSVSGGELVVLLLDDAGLALGGENGVPAMGTVGECLLTCREWNGSGFSCFITLGGFLRDFVPRLGAGNHVRSC